MPIGNIIKAQACSTYILERQLGIEIQKYTKFAILEFNWKRCVFRTVTIAILLFIAQSVPDFGSILDLIGGSTITCLTFVMPPFLYITVINHSQTRYTINAIYQKILHNYFLTMLFSRNLAWYEQIYCWFLILVGIIGGISATFTAIKNIIDGAALKPPCYIKPFQILRIQILQFYYLTGYF